MAEYLIQSETITPLFDQIRRITETTDAMTFEGATVSLLNVVPGGAFPSAEEASFGADDADSETGILSLGTLKYDSRNTRYYPFNKYTAKEAISIIGLRWYVITDTDSQCLRLWNANDEMVRETNQITPVLNTWTTEYFDKPFNVATGESFTISVSGFMHPTYSSLSNTTINEKVTFVGSAQSTADSFPSTFMTYNVWGVVDFIIGKVSAELPDEYQIDRTTMDDIANEVKRISGATGKISTAKMLTALQSITLQDKTVTPTAEVQTVTPDDGYIGLSSVTVGAIEEGNQAVVEIVDEKMEVIANDTY